MERPINIGPFRLHLPEKIVKGPDGTLDALTYSQVSVLEILAKGQLAGRTWLKPADIASSAFVSETSVANCVAALNKALGPKSIENKSGYGYVLKLPASWCDDENVSATTSTLPPIEQTTPPGFAGLARSLRPISPEIKAFGERHGITPIDQYIQLRSSPGWLGWPRGRVATFPEVIEHDPLPELKRLTERFPGTGAINLLYGLNSWNCDLTLDDEIAGEEEIPYLHLSATGGSWKHIYALQAAWRLSAATDPKQSPDEECLAIHRTFEEELSQFIVHKRSRLYHAATAEAILVTNDNQIILARRSEGTNASPGLWSASFEEQVLRSRKRDAKSDRGDLFTAAERGAWEEFGVKIIPEASRLLAFGVEWGAFTLAFIVLLRCHETFDEVRNWSWEHVAADPTEAAAIDCMDAENEDDIRRFFLLEEWAPTQRAKRSNLIPGDAPDPLRPNRWHPVARARLLAYLLHKESSR